MCVYVSVLSGYFPSLGFVSMRLSIDFVCVGVANFLGLEFSF